MVGIVNIYGMGRQNIPGRLIGSNMRDLIKFICRLTGASQGIGERLAYEFAKYGAVLSLSARKEDQLKKLCDSLNRSGGQAKYYPLDVTKIDQIEATYKKVRVVPIST